MLDGDQRDLSFVTSSNPVAGGGDHRIECRPNKIDKVAGVSKPIPAVLVMAHSYELFDGRTGSDKSAMSMNFNQQVGLVVLVLTRIVMRHSRRVRNYQP